MAEPCCCWPFRDPCEAVSTWETNLRSVPFKAVCGVPSMRQIGQQQSAGRDHVVGWAPVSRALSLRIGLLAQARFSPVRPSIRLVLYTPPAYQPLSLPPSPSPPLPSFLTRYDVQSRFLLALDGQNSVTKPRVAAVINPIVHVLPLGSTQQHHPAIPSTRHDDDNMTWIHSRDGRLVPEICLLVELQPADETQVVGDVVTCCNTIAEQYLGCLSEASSRSC